MTPGAVSEIDSHREITVDGRYSYLGIACSHVKVKGRDCASVTMDLTTVVGSFDGYHKSGANDAAAEDGDVKSVLNGACVGLMSM